MITSYHKTSYHINRRVQLRHHINQFQVFVDGSGKVGRHAALPITVQYANGYTPYGPIEAGVTGVRYFTLRQQWDPGAK